MTATPLQRLACDQAAATSEQSTRCLLAAFAYLGVPRLMVDIGCGDGHLVVMAARMGVVAIGVDIGMTKRVAQGALEGEDFLVKMHCSLWQTDLSHPFDPGTADLVLCLEVAEHLPESAADTLCDTVAGAVAPGGTLLFSAATPGQGGAGHLNEQPHDYWHLRLAARGLRQHVHLTIRLRAAWAEVASAAWWYGNNLLVYRRQA